MLNLTWLDSSHHLYSVRVVPPSQWRIMWEWRKKISGGVIELDSDHRPPLAWNHYHVLKAMSVVWLRIHQHHLKVIHMHMEGMVITAHAFWRPPSTLPIFTCLSIRIGSNALPSVIWQLLITDGNIGVRWWLTAKTSRLILHRAWRQSPLCTQSIFPHAECCKYGLDNLRTLGWCKESDVGVFPWCSARRRNLGGAVKPGHQGFMLPSRGQHHDRTF